MPTRIGFREIFDEAKLRFGDVTSREFAPKLLKRVIQHAYGQVRNQIVRKNPWLFEKDFLFDWTSGTQQYNLPEDFLYELAMRRTGSVSQPYPLGRAGARDRDTTNSYYPYDQTNSSSITGNPTHYYLIGKKAGFVPTPNATLVSAATLTYVPSTPKVGEFSYILDPVTSPTAVEVNNLLTGDKPYFNTTVGLIVQDNFTDTTGAWKCPSITMAAINEWYGSFDVREVFDTGVIWGKSALQAVFTPSNPIFHTGLEFNFDYKNPAPVDLSEATHLSWSFHILDQDSLDVIQAASSTVTFAVLNDTPDSSLYTFDTSDFLIGNNIWIVSRDQFNDGGVGAIWSSVDRFQFQFKQSVNLEVIGKVHTITFDGLAVMDLSEVDNAPSSLILHGTAPWEEGLWQGEINRPEHQEFVEWVILETLLRMDDMTGRGLEDRARKGFESMRADVSNNVLRLLNDRQRDSLPRIRSPRRYR